MEKIKLNDIVADRLHQPRVSGLPIYARVDGAAEIGDGKTGNKPSDWEKVVKTRKNSPDNVRRVFITHKGVYVHYYKPITGVNNAGLKSEKTYKENIVEIRHNLEAHTGKYVVTGTGINALVKPWVCSNIEEVYFDWMILLSDEVKNMFGITQPNQINEKFVQEFFRTVCCRDTKEVSSRFPRLRAVGYIHNLEEVYKRVPDKPGMDSIEDIKTPWSVNEIVKAEKLAGRAHLWFVNNKELNEAYSLKPNVYLFDSEVLSVHFEDLLKRIEKYKAEKVAELKKTVHVVDLDKHETPESKQGYTQEQQQTQEPPKQGFEVMLDRFHELGGNKEVVRALKVTLKGFKQSEGKALFNSLSESGRAKYKECFDMLYPKKN